MSNEIKLEVLEELIKRIEKLEDLTTVKEAIRDCTLHLESEAVKKA